MAKNKQKDNEVAINEDTVEQHPIYVDKALAAKTDDILHTYKGAFLEHWEGVSFDWTCKCVEYMFDQLTLQWQWEETPADEDDSCGDGRTYDVTNFTYGSDTECYIALYRDKKNPEELAHMNIAIRLEKERAAELYQKMQDYFTNGGKLPKIEPDNKHEYGTREYVEERLNIKWTDYEVDKEFCAYDYFEGKRNDEETFEFVPADNMERAELTHYMISRIGRFFALSARALKKAIVHDNLCRAIIHQIYAGEPNLFDKDEMEAIEKRPELLERQRKSAAEELKLLMIIGEGSTDDKELDEAFAKIVPKQG